MENDNNNIGAFQSIMSQKARALLEMLDQTVSVLQKEEGFYDNDEKAEADLIIKLIERIQGFLLAGDQGSEEKTIRVLKTFLALRGREIGQRGYTFSPFSKMNQACLAIATAIQEEQAVCQLLIPSVQPSPEESDFDYTQNEQLFSPEQFMLLETQQLIHIPTLMEYALTNTSNLFPCADKTIKPIYLLSENDRIFLRDCATPSSKNLYTTLKKLHDSKYGTFLGALENLEQALRNSSISSARTPEERREREDVAAVAELLEPLKHFNELWKSLSKEAHQQIDSLTIQYSGYTISLKSLINFILVNAYLISSKAKVEEAKNFPIMNCTKMLSDAISQFREEYLLIFSSIRLKTDEIEAHKISEINELYNTFIGELSNPEIRSHLIPLKHSSTLLFNEARFYELVELSFQNETSEKIENFIAWIKPFTLDNLFDFFKLEQYALLDLPLKEIMILFQEKYIELILTPEQLGRMISYLPAEKIKEIMILFQEKFKELIQTSDQLGRMISCLSARQINGLIMAFGDQIKKIIKDCNALIQVLKRLPDAEQRKELISTAGIFIIKNSQALSSLLSHLEQAERTWLIEEGLKEEIQFIIPDINILSPLLSRFAFTRLTVAEKKQLITAVGFEKIKNSNDLISVLFHLEEAERSWLINNLINRINEIIRNSDELAAVIEAGRFSEVDRKKLITALGGKIIKNLDDLINMLESNLNVADKIELITTLGDRMKDLINHSQVLINLLDKFPKDEQCLKVLFVIGGNKSSMLLSKLSKSDMFDYERVKYDRYVALAKALKKAENKAENIILEQKITGKSELCQIKLILKSYCNPGFFKKHHKKNIDAITKAINTKQDVSSLLEECANIARKANPGGTFFALNKHLQDRYNTTSAANLAL